jgi:hypothetical protein
MQNYIETNFNDVALGRRDSPYNGRHAPSLAWDSRSLGSTARRRRRRIMR